MHQVENSLGLKFLNFLFFIPNYTYISTKFDNSELYKNTKIYLNQKFAIINYLKFKIMNFSKTLQTIGCLVVMLFSIQASAQTAWKSCGTSGGLLSGTTTNIYMTDTIAPAVHTVPPTPSATVPKTEFLAMLTMTDSLAIDSLGGAIIATSLTGEFSPQDLGLSVGDTFTVVSFSYDLLKIKKAVQGVLFNSVFFLGTCCSIIQNQVNINVCAELNAAGIMDSSDVNNVNDLLLFLGAFSGGGSTSLRGLNAVLFGINDQIGLLSNAGCTNGVSEICYTTDSLAANQDHYVVTTMVNVQNVEGNAALQIAVSPNPFMDQIATGIRSEVGGEHFIRVIDATGRTVHQEIQQLSTGEQTIWLNLGDLSAGMYYLQVSDSKNIATQKIVKR